MKEANEAQSMKVVQINTFSYKATGNIMMNIHRLLRAAGHDSYVCWGRGRKAESDHEIVIADSLGVKLHGVYTRLFDKSGFASIMATKRLLNRLSEIKPDIIHIHNLHGYYINIQLLFEYIKQHKIKVVWTLHDCWALTGHCAWFDMCGCEKWKTGCNHCEQLDTYPASKWQDNSLWNWKKKKELFTGGDITIVTPSHWLEDLVKKSFLKDYPVKVIYNGIDLNVFRPTHDNDVRRKYGLDGRPVILGVASEWTPRKGLNDFAELSKQMYDVQFVVVGLTDRQLMDIPSTLKGIKRTDSQAELAVLYTLADVFFNPTYEDNFPTTNLEALACGTPVVTYDTGGSPEAVIEGGKTTGCEIGCIIKKSSPESVNLEEVKKALVNTLQTIAKTPEIRSEYCTAANALNREKNISAPSSICGIEEICLRAASEFDMNVRLKEYLTLYQTVIA